ncbi:hypothetical protein RLIN73S_02846 [Rhodanobacter lindaniclasticus]
MKTLRTLCMLALLFAAMAQAQEADSVIEQAEAAVASKLKDPESAHFTDVTISDKGNLVCGWVNAKNSFGGYAGFRPFVVSGSYVQLRDEPNVGPLNNRGIFAITWNACRPLGAEVFGSAHVDLPKINSAKYCKRLRKTLSRVSETSPDCERDEAEAQAWLQTHTTDAWVARDCAQKAREVRSYGTARSCVREGEADIVFQRGPRR